MQQQRGRIFTINQAAELAERITKAISENWPKIEPLLVDPRRKQILESISGLVGRTLADTDFVTGEFLYPTIRSWIDKQRPGYAWREVKDEKGNSFVPPVFAPSDEDVTIAVANACLLPTEIPVPLPTEEAERMKKELSAFFSNIERSAEKGKFKYEDWVKMIDDLSHNPTKQAFLDLFSAMGYYGRKYFGALIGQLRMRLGDELIDRAVIEAKTEKTRQWAMRQKAAYHEQMPDQKLFSWIKKRLKRR